MKRALAFLLAGLVIGELDPIGWAVWQILERRLPEMKRRSLAASSPFEEMPESRWLAESERAYVIENRHAPTAAVHLLVVSKKRYASMLEAPSDLLGEMLGLARRAARQQEIADPGFRVVVNTNPNGAQTVYHLHMHVKGGEQVREPLLPYLWGRLTHL